MILINFFLVFSFVGNVFVSKYDEEYIMTFPSAYARYILLLRRKFIYLLFYEKL